eukprot:2419285-Pleurochrysis_carterae.AAC.2
MWREAACCTSRQIASEATASPPPESMRSTTAFTCDERQSSVLQSRITGRQGSHTARARLSTRYRTVSEQHTPRAHTSARAPTPEHTCSYSIAATTRVKLARVHICAGVNRTPAHPSPRLTTHISAPTRARSRTRPRAHAHAAAFAHDPTRTRPRPHGLTPTTARPHAPPRPRPHTTARAATRRNAPTHAAARLLVLGGVPQLFAQLCDADAAAA